MEPPVAMTPHHRQASLFIFPVLMLISPLRVSCSCNGTASEVHYTPSTPVMPKGWGGAGRERLLEEAGPSSGHVVRNLPGLYSDTVAYTRIVC